MNKRVTLHRDTDVESDKDPELAGENDWLRRENGIRVERSQKYKVIPDTSHALNIGSNLLKSGQTIRALKMAAALRQPPMGYIHHMDRRSLPCIRRYAFERKTA